MGTPGGTPGGPRGAGGTEDRGQGAQGPKHKIHRHINIQTIMINRLTITQDRPYVKTDHTVRQTMLQDHTA